MDTGPGEFDVVVRHDGDRAVVAPTGELDIATVPRLRAEMRDADGAPEVVLDLRGLRFLDTSGLRAVIEEEHLATDAGRRLWVVRGSNAVQRVFELAGVADRIPFVAEEP
ncbi:MAG TPA: STAS domain-containing protein [Solirubrobacteraceae bacterium]